jgi:ParB family chromosome partitioning protein
MKLAFIEHDKLFVDKTNMHYGRKAPDVSDIQPSIRKRGVLIPLVVRPAANDHRDDRFGIVGGRRRWTANGNVRAEGIDHGPLPCAILEDGDDAAAIEASMLENFQRLDPDEVTRWETFAKLVREGRDTADIAETFGIPELMVARSLALGNLLPRIRNLYRADKIDRASIQHLTLASRKQQTAWLALFNDPKQWTPRGRQLKEWLFGGACIPVKNALFDTENIKGIKPDLFDEDSYFADVQDFWTAQNAAIDARRDAYLDAGWSDVVIIPPGEIFRSYEFAKAGKQKGGRVYIKAHPNGEVEFHEGYVTEKEAKKIAKGEAVDTGPKAPRPEITGTMQNYIDLHRHAAARAALTRHPKVALRLMVAHAVIGSSLWNLRHDWQRANNDAVRESFETCKGETDFDAKRRAVLALLGFDPERKTVVAQFDTGRGDESGLVALFLRLLELPERAVMDVLMIVMGETLAVGSAAVEAVGGEIGVDMARYWQADDAFFESVRDREVLTQIVAEVAGDTVAAANANEKATTMKRIVRDHLDGANERAKVEGWTPKWLAFPPAAYTARGGVGTVEKAALVAAARAELEPKPTDPGAVVALPAPKKPKRRKPAASQPEREAA